MARRGLRQHREHQHGQRTNGRAFQARYVIAQAADHGNAGGVQVAGIASAARQGRLVYEPDHPLADAEGYVRCPTSTSADQMTQLIMAQRGYQANLAVVDRAQDAYQRRPPARDVTA